MGAQDKTEDIKFVHGFYLDLADGPSDWRLPVIPNRVVDVKPKNGGGSSITIQTDTGETRTVNVTQGPEFVNEAIRRCRELDKIAGVSGSLSKS